jgi:hypothetical protein
MSVSLLRQVNLAGWEHNLHALLNPDWVRSTIVTARRQLGLTLRASRSPVLSFCTSGSLRTCKYTTHRGRGMGLQCFCVLRLYCCWVLTTQPAACFKPGVCSSNMQHGV